MRCKKCDTNVRAWRFALEVCWRLTVMGFCDCGETCTDSHEDWERYKLHETEASAGYDYGIWLPLEVLGQRHGGGVQLRLPFAK